MNSPTTPGAARLGLPAMKSILMAAAVGLLAFGTVATTMASRLAAHVAPPNSKPHGQSYAEWSAAWFQWCLSLETTHNPIFDTADCSTGQSGHVWFIGPNFTGTPLTRNCTVPEGTSLFFILIGYWADNTGCPTPSTYSPAELEGLIGPTMDQATHLFCTIDGVPVQGLSDGTHTAYRAKTVFDYTVPPANNILLWQGLSCYAQTGPTPSPIDVSGAVADGVYVFLEPLPAGNHTLHFGGSVPGFSEDATYHITVGGGYSFKKLRTLGDPIPSRPGLSFMGDFEPSDLNNHGQETFIADLSSGSEGVFRITHGQVMPILIAGDTAPGGGTFGGFGSMGKAALNHNGDVAVGFNLLPAGATVGVNAGLYLYSSQAKSLTALVTPFVTPVPGGGKFQGINFSAAINDNQTVAFAGVVQTDHGIHIPGQTYSGLGVSVFQAGHDGKISSVVRAGDPTPQGGTFDFFENPAINGAGDIAFDSHRAEDALISPSDLFTATTGIYLMKHDSHNLVAIARQGDTLPGGGDSYRVVFGPVLNNSGQIAFIADLASGAMFGQSEALVLYQGDHRYASVARPGDLMPGGARVVTTSFQPGNYDLNNHGAVAFGAALDSDDNHDGISDTGLYVWSQGKVFLIARTGTTIRGVGVIAHLRNAYAVPPGVPDFGATGGVALNDHGQIFFSAVLSDSRVVLLMATPNP